MGKPESIVEHYLVQQCEKAGLLCRKYISPGRRGVPDRIVIGGGRTVFIETKSAVGRLSNLQKREIKRMLSHGADVRIYNTRQQVDNFIAEAATWPHVETPIPEDMALLLQ